MSEKYTPETAREEQWDLLGRANALHGFLRGLQQAGHDTADIRTVASIIGFDDLADTEPEPESEAVQEWAKKTSLREIIKELESMTDQIDEGACRICVLLDSE